MARLRISSTGSTVAEPYAEVIGDPVAHSLSPTIHSYWLDYRDLPGSYRAMRCDAQALAPYLAGRRDDPLWRGCNVTMPLKELAAARMDWLDDGAARAGAINCVVPRDGELHGYNTDIDAVLRAVETVDLAGKRAVVLGAGGVARAALVALGARGAQRVVLARNADRRLALRALGADVQDAPLYAIREALEDAAVVINATPLGMAGDERIDIFLLEALEAAARPMLVIDMVYRPVETEFLSTARAIGMPTVDGLTLLIGQARRSFSLLFGAEPPPWSGPLRADLVSRLRAG